jgi:hypothetical protein
MEVIDGEVTVSDSYLKLFYPFVFYDILSLNHIFLYIYI